MTIERRYHPFERNADTLRFVVEAEILQKKRDICNFVRPQNRPAPRAFAGKPYFQLVRVPIELQTARARALF